MKKNEWAQLKTAGVPELKSQLTALKESLWNLKKELTAGKSKNVRKIREVHKNIARTMTLLNNSNPTK